MGGCVEGGEGGGGGGGGAVKRRLIYSKVSNLSFEVTYDFMIHFEILP